MGLLYNIYTVAIMMNPTATHTWHLTNVFFQTAGYDFGNSYIISLATFLFWTHEHQILEKNR